MESKTQKPVVEMEFTALTTDHVRSVYTGKDGHCCCGCSGNHRYNSKHVAAAAKDRGYPLAAKEINDRQVASVLRRIKEGVKSAFDVNSHGDRTDHIYARVGDRCLILYLVDGIRVSVANANEAAS